MTTDLFAPRQGRPAPDGPYEGVPPHLRRQLARWVMGAYRRPDGLEMSVDRQAVEHMAALLRIDLWDAEEPLKAIIGYAVDDAELFLDLLHYTLKLPLGTTTAWKRLEVLLFLGSSAWRATENGLERTR